MVGWTKKRSSTAKQTTSTTVTGRRVKRLTATRPTKASEPGAAAKPKKAVKPGASAKRKAIPPATRTQHRSLSTVKKSVTFTLDAPASRDVSIAGYFNDWKPQAMIKERDGLWRATLQLAPGTYRYRFLVDTIWREDPNNPSKVLNDSGGFDSICVNVL